MQPEPRHDPSERETQQQQHAQTCPVALPEPAPRDLTWLRRSRRSARLRQLGPIYATPPLQHLRRVVGQQSETFENMLGAPEPVTTALLLLPVLALLGKAISARAD